MTANPNGRRCRVSLGQLNAGLHDEARAAAAQPYPAPTLDVFRLFRVARMTGKSGPKGVHGVQKSRSRFELAPDDPLFQEMAILSLPPSLTIHRPFTPSS